MAIQYWIDGSGGRLRYAESLLQSGTAQPLANGVPVPPRWYTIALRQRSDGACTVTYTDLLDATERGLPFVCRLLRSGRDVPGERSGLPGRYQGVVRHRVPLLRRCL